MRVEKTPRGGQSVYLFDKFIENAEKTIQKSHTDNFESFIQNHQNSLKQKLHDYSNSEEDFSAVWDETQFPIKFNHVPPQKDALFDLLTTENELLRKVVMTLSFLCNEMNTLQEIVNQIIHSSYFYKKKKRQKRNIIRF